MDLASKWYGVLMANYESKTDSEYFFKYAQALRAEGKFTASDDWMAKFKSKDALDTRAIDFVANKDDLSILRTTSDEYTVRNSANINTSYSDYGVSYYQDKVLFASSKKEGQLVKRKFAWTKEPFLDFYQATPNASGFLENVENFSKTVNSIYHESNASFSPDGQTMYFTRNNYSKGKYKTSAQGVNNLKLYSANRIQKKDSTIVWADIKELPFNSDEYSVGHPSVTADGNRLYFASDMPGGQGQTDIYYVSIKGDNSFGSPINAGDIINTEGREMFPFIAKDNTLYFSSDGHFGQGGLDIFKSKIEKNTFTDVIALPSPMNSSTDDFSLVINETNTAGYLSSNRVGGKGGDDIYSFTRKEIPLCKQLIAGIVRDIESKEPIGNARLILKDSFGLVLKDTLANSLGEFSFNLPCDKDYTVIATKEIYTPDQETFSSNRKDKVILELTKPATDKIEEVFVLNDENALIIKIKPIYFNFDKANIRPDARIELDRIVTIMNKYPNLVISSNSHTDARGKDSYNEILSDKRAKSTVKYIISKGISPDRISVKGYGETKLVNNCIDNSRGVTKCSKEQHQANRRTEFVIVKM